MTPTVEDAFSQCSELIKRAAKLIEGQISQIEEREHNTAFVSSWEAQRSAAVQIFRVRSLQLYRDTLLFLAGQILDADWKHHYFLLPHVRTLLDIYARFIHLFERCEGFDKQALTCIAYQVITVKTLNSEAAYQTTLMTVDQFLQKIGFAFPGFEDLKFSWIKNQNLHFAKRDELLTTENMKKYSTYTLDIFKPSNTYDIYSYLSEFMHGNPYYYNETPYNERFWVASMTLSTTAFLLELVDCHVLSRIQTRDFRVWLKDVEKNRTDFMQVWRARIKELRDSKLDLPAE